jgi:hypothetical protein
MSRQREPSPRQLEKMIRQGTRPVPMSFAWPRCIINVNSAITGTGSRRVSKSSSSLLLTPPYPYIDRHGRASTEEAM